MSGERSLADQLHGVAVAIRATHPAASDVVLRAAAHLRAVEVAASRANLWRCGNCAYLNDANARMCANCNLCSREGKA